MVAPNPAPEPPPPPPLQESAFIPDMFALFRKSGYKLWISSLDTADGSLPVQTTLFTRLEIPLRSDAVVVHGGVAAISDGQHLKLYKLQTSMAI